MTLSLPSTRRGGRRRADSRFCSGRQQPPGLPVAAGQTAADLPPAAGRPLSYGRLQIENIDCGFKIDSDTGHVD